MGTKGFVQGCAQSTALGFIMWISSPALAQPGPTEAEPPKGSADAGEIVVTARRVAERLQDVPVAVTVYDSASLEAKNAVKLSDLSGDAPGLQIQTSQTSGSSIAYFSLRGQYQRSNLATSDPSVGVYVDGIYWARAYGINSGLLDMESVQVLRGPQGTLFGRNTNGGAILLKTQDPDLNEFGGRVAITYGRFDRVAGLAVLNAPISRGKIALRLAAQAEDDDGYIKDELHFGRKYGETRNFSARAKLLAQVSDDVELMISGDVHRERRASYPGQIRFVTSSSPANLSVGAEILGSAACFADTLSCTALGRERLQSAIARQQGRDDVVRYNVIPLSDTKTNTFVARLRYDLQFADLEVVGGYRTVKERYFSDFDGSEYRLMEIAGVIDMKQWSAEANLSGSAAGGRVKYALGGFYFDERGLDETLFPALVAINPRITKFSGVIDNKSIGLYGQATVSINDRLSLTGGLRWSQDKKAVTINNGSVLGSIYGEEPGSFLCSVGSGCPSNPKGKFSGLSYTAGIDYRFSPDVMGYAKVSSGFRSGGVNLRETTLVAGAPADPFKPEKMTSFEIGAKSELFDRRVRLNVAAFYMIGKDLQREFVVTNNGITTTVAGNAERADFSGGEAELVARIVDSESDRFVLSANAAHVSPKYKDYTDPATGFDRSRERFPAVPRWTFSIGGQYEKHLGSRRIAANVTYNWASAYSAFSEFNYYIDEDGVARDASSGAAIPLADAQGLVKAFRKSAGGTLDARLALSLADERYEIALFGRNILNNRQFMSTGSVRGIAVPGLRRPPATWGVTLSAKR